MPPFALLKFGKEVVGVVEGKLAFGGLVVQQAVCHPAVYLGAGEYFHRLKMPFTWASFGCFGNQETDISRHKWTLRLDLTNKCTEQKITFYHCLSSTYTRSVSPTSLARWPSIIRPGSPRPSGFEFRCLVRLLSAPAG